MFIFFSYLNLKISLGQTSINTETITDTAQDSTPSNQTNLNDEQVIAATPTIGIVKRCIFVSEDFFSEKIHHRLKHQSLNEMLMFQLMIVLKQFCLILIHRLFMFQNYQLQSIQVTNPVKKPLHNKIINIFLLFIQA